MAHTTAVSDTAACLRRTSAALAFGHELQHGAEDGNEAHDNPFFYGVRGPRGVYRSALPDLSGRNSYSCDEILEIEEEEHDEADYGDYFDRIEANARHARPDNSEGVIQAFRGGEGPSGIDRVHEARGYRPGQVLVIPGGLFRDYRRPEDRRVLTAPAPTAAPKRVPTDEHGKRVEMQRRLERAGMKPGLAVEAAAKAKFAPTAPAKIGTLGAKLLASVAASGSAQALDVRPAPAAHRRIVRR